MAPIFTEQWANEQHLLEEKRASDALRLAHTQKSKQTVFVYVWLHVCYIWINICAFLTSAAQNDTDPIVVEFQDGFIWPYFIISASALARVGLGSLPPTVSLNLYRPHMRLWTGISVDHIVHLTINNTRIFLKPSNVQSCQDLQVHTSMNPFITRMDVTAERAHMKSRMELQNLERAYAVLAATPNSKRRLSPTSTEPASPPLKRRAAKQISVVPIAQPCSAAATRIKRRRTGNVIKKDTSIITLGSDSEYDTDESDPFSSPLRHHSETPSLVQQSSVTSLQPFVIPLQASPAPDEPFEDIPGAKVTWPGQLSVNDIVVGFTSIDTLSRRPGFTVSKAFEKVFGAKFPGTKFYEHRNRWNSASQDDRDAAQVSNLSWVSFAETHPTSRATVKATRKRQLRLLRQTVDGTPELSQDGIEFVL